MKQLRYKAVEQSTLSSPLRICAVADGGTAILAVKKVDSMLTRFVTC